MLFEKLQFLLFDMIFSMRTFWVVRAHFCCVFFLVQNSIMLLFKKILVLFVLYDLLNEKSAVKQFFFPLFLSVEGWVRSESLWYMQECFHNERYELFTRNGSLLLLFFLRFCECLQCLLMHFNFPFFFFLLCICFPFPFLDPLLFFFCFVRVAFCCFSRMLCGGGVKLLCEELRESISFLVWSCSCSFCSCASCQTSFFSFLFFLNSGGFFRGGRNTLFV